jgi:4a-hydroxytetrahydrobiopterin dehydratase
MNLSEKHCVECKAGTLPLPPEKAQAMLKDVPGWDMSDDGKWLLKTYKFKNFVQALAFTNKVGEVAEQENHHPDFGLGWGYVNIRLQTHAVGGLHENDFVLAAKIEKIQ